MPHIRARTSNFRYTLEELKFVRSFEDFRILYQDFAYLLPRTIGLLDTHSAVPPSLQIEPTNYCNLDCLCCPVPRSARARGFMSIELFERIVDDAATSGVKRLRLFLHGEPLLHPHFGEMVALAKTRGLAVHITTNGMPLSEKTGRAILGAGVTRADHLTVSILGASKQVVEEIMRRTNYDRVVENVLRFMELRQEMQMKGPVVETIFYTMPQNEHEEEEFVRYWRGKVDHARLGGRISEAFAQVGQAGELHIARKKTCTNLWERMTVYWNGNVTLCCQDVEGLWILGNLGRQTIREVWNSELLNSIKQIHRTGQFEKFPFCAECDM
jgi:radical SAM protein with 4Fe4S-binding SPASM domain